MNIYIHGIMEDHVRGAPTYTQICDQINSILAGSICATHTHFDRSAIQQCCARHDLPLPECNWLDTARVARRTWDAVARKGYGLANLASMLGIEFKHHDCESHRTGGSHSSTGAYAAPIKHEGSPDGPLFGEVVVFTGALTIPRSEAAKMAANLGCSVNIGVSKKMLAGHQRSSKHRKTLDLDHSRHP